MTFKAGNFMAGDFLAGNFLAHRVTFGNFMAGNFLAGDFMGGYRLPLDILLSCNAIQVIDSIQHTYIPHTMTRLYHNFVI